MKMKYSCFPCVLRQSLESVQMLTDDDQKIKKVMNYYAEIMPEALKKERTAPELAGKMQEYIKKIAGSDDPYRKFKENNLKKAKKIIPLVKEEMKKAEDTLVFSLLISAMGNSIDAGVSLDVDIKKNIDAALKNSFAHSDYEKFREEIKTAERILIIADNTGEALFDKLLLQELKKFDLDISYVVRGVPILNDITKKQALALGIGEYAEIINSGSKTPGLIIDDVSREFRQAYQKADLVISKGQGNLEGLLDIESDIYFLLKAKCEVIAEVLNVKKDDFLFLYR